MVSAAQPYLVKLLRDGLRDAVVVVIGGTGGIGREVARQADELGAQVVVASRTAPNAPIGRTSHLCVDVACSGSIRHLAERVSASFGRVNILVNSAGASVQVPANRLDLLTDEIIDAVLATSARAPLIIAREFAGLLLAGRDPVLVNVSSIAALTGGGSNIAYAAAKAGLDTAARALAKALGPAVRVVNVAPSALETEFVKGRDQRFLDATAQASALRRLATPEEVATAILCAARMLTATTGVSIAVDAGRHL